MKKKILAVMLSMAMIMASSTTAFAVTKSPNATPGSWCIIENTNNNVYLDYISNCAFNGKTVYLEDIPFSEAGDGSDTEGVIVNIGDIISTKDYITYPDDAAMEVRMFNNNHYEGAWAYVEGYQLLYIVGIGDNNCFMYSDEELAEDPLTLFQDETVSQMISEYQIITNNGTLTKWKAFRRKFSDSDGVFVKIVPAM